MRFAMVYRAIFRIVTLLAAGCLFAAVTVSASGPAGTGDGHYRKVPRQVTLIIEPRRLLASNVRLSRLDEIKLLGNEQYLRHEESRAAIVVATNRRILAYGPVIGWRSMQLRPDEQVESLQAEDYAVFVVTDQRYFNFSADTGIWAQKRRTDR